MSWHSKLLDETLYLYVSNVSFDRTIVRASTNWTSNKNIYIHIHNWFFFSVIQGTGNVPKETRRSNMIGKQPPLQRFASMRRLFAGSRLRCAHDWFVWPRPTSVVVYLCLNLRNVSYIATSHRHTPCHVSNLDPTSFFSFHHSLGRVYRLKGDPPRTKPSSLPSAISDSSSLFRTSGQKRLGGKASAGQRKPKRDYTSMGRPAVVGK